MISLIICTRNRCAALAPCLEQLRRIHLPAEQWEAVIVDNGSTDGTRALLERFSQEVPFRVTVVVLDQPGLGRARNAGIAAAKGDILAFTDDDCYVDPNFLSSISQILRSNDVGCIGGRILLHDPTDAPVTIKVDETVEVLEPFSFVEAGFIHGANMAVKREVIDRLGGFDANLGGGNPIGGEDVDFFARASQTGFRVGYFPQPLVYHHHQRKPGSEIHKLKSYYDHARGAYYAKFLMIGISRPTYLKHWYWSIRSSLRRRDYFTPARELRGAFHYAACALRNPRWVRLSTSH